MPIRTFHAWILKLVVAALALGATGAAADGQGWRLFVSSAAENAADHTVTLPLHRGSTADGRTVWYVVLDASSDEAALQYGVNRADKLNNALGTAAVQRADIVDGGIVFPATVDFTPQRIVVPGPSGFPPAAVQPGAIGEPGYSPLVQLPDGTILNAPHVANDSGQADKVVALNTGEGTVVYRETEGRSNGKTVYYVSTDASDAAAAALEDVSFAPQLNAAPFAGGDGTDSARASLTAFVNGQTGIDNPSRQGLNSALLDGLDPLNVLRWTPNQGRYSPLWDVHLAQWSAETVATGGNTRQADFGRIADLAAKALVRSPGGVPFGPAGFIVNCPIISEDD